jgi:hypothetical protein
MIPFLHPQEWPPSLVKKRFLSNQIRSERESEQKENGKDGPRDEASLPVKATRYVLACGGYVSF